jgi:hypothetical protein
LISIPVDAVLAEDAIKAAVADVKKKREAGKQ